MNGKDIWTPSLSFHMVIPFLNLLVIGRYFLYFFPSFFPFRFLFFPKLACVRLLNLHSKVFPKDIYRVFLVFFSSLYLIYKGIYSFFMDSLKDWLKLGPLIKIRELWIKVNSWKLLYKTGFAMVVLVLRILGDFVRLKG